MKFQEKRWLPGLSILSVLLTSVVSIAPVVGGKAEETEAENLGKTQRASPTSFLKKRLILSIDGGGIRGILPARLLNFLEEEMEAEIRKAYPEAPAPEFRIGT